MAMACVSRGQSGPRCCTFSHLPAHLPPGSDAGVPTPALDNEPRPDQMGRARFKNSALGGRPIGAPENRPGSAQGAHPVGSVPRSRNRTCAGPNSKPEHARWHGVVGPRVALQPARVAQTERSAHGGHVAELLRPGSNTCPGSRIWARLCAELIARTSRVVSPACTDSRESTAPSYATSLVLSQRSS